MNNLRTKKEKTKVQVEQQFIYLIMNIIETYPQYSLSQHLCHILRRKGDSDEAYYWDEEKFLKKVEDYYDELNHEFSESISED